MSRLEYLAWWALMGFLVAMIAGDQIGMRLDDKLKQMRREAEGR